MDQRASQWLEQADHELAFAQINYDHGGYDIAAVLSQQSVEKRLKGMILASGSDFTRTHNLYKLAKDLEHAAETTFDDADLDHLKDLSTLQVAARYPVDDGDMAPAAAITRSRAAEAIDTARRWADLLPAPTNGTSP
jgi:HEPN domain-containing protein